MKRIFLLLIMVVLLAGCGLKISSPTIDTTTPFNADAVIYIDGRAYNSKLIYSQDKEFSLEVVPDKINSQVRQIATEGGTEVIMGDQRFSYPADWGGAFNTAQLIRAALSAPNTVTKQDGRLVAQGTASNVPFVIESDLDGNILLSIAFPTLDIKIDLTVFIRQA